MASSQRRTYTYIYEYPRRLATGFLYIVLLAPRNDPFGRLYAYVCAIYIIRVRAGQERKKNTPEQARDRKRGRKKIIATDTAAGAGVGGGVIRRAISDASEFRRRTTSAVYIYIYRIYGPF